MSYLAGVGGTLSLVLGLLLWYYRGRARSAEKALDDGRALWESTKAANAALVKENGKCRDALAKRQADEREQEKREAQEARTSPERAAGFLAGLRRDPA